MERARLRLIDSSSCVAAGCARRAAYADAIDKFLADLGSRLVVLVSDSDPYFFASTTGALAMAPNAGRQEIFSRRIRQDLFDDSFRAPQYRA